MKLNYSQIFIVIFVLCPLCHFDAFAQGVPSGLRTVPEDTAKIQDVLSKSERSFKQGLLNLKDNKRPLARDDFDHSVEAFLLSGINVRTNAKLQKCYSALIETIYRIEIPSAQTPEVKGLATTCGWTLENEFNEIAVALQQAPAAQQTDKNAQVASADTELPLAPQTGFLEQKNEPSPLDELAKLELTPDTAESKAADKYLNPKVIKAKVGDTVRTIALRLNLSATELAKFNRLLPDSKLFPGREIKIPLSTIANSLTNQQYIRVRLTSDEKLLGSKPFQLKNGRVQSVMDYFNENLHDPYSMRFVNWSPVVKVSLGGVSYWAVKVKYRAKNIYGAYVLNEAFFYIQKNKVVKVNYLSH